MATGEKVKIELVTAPVQPALEQMTFPVYRHLLVLEPTARHPEQGDTKMVQPLAVSARIEDAPIGLALGEAPTNRSDRSDRESVPQLLSVFTRPETRNRGVATRLVARLEEELTERGFERLETTYMTGKASEAAVERLLEKRGWSAPLARTVTLRFTPAEALSTPWFGRLKLPESKYEIFPWTELRPEERAELERSQAESGWIAKGLEPWEHDRHGFDPVSSIGLRYRGQVIGWVINHRLSENTVRFTCSFMNKPLGRRGRIFPLYTASLQRLKESGCKMCTLVTPVVYQTMVEFVKRRCAPWATFFGETRGSSKVLTRPV